MIRCMNIFIYILYTLIEHCRCESFLDAPGGGLFRQNKGGKWGSGTIKLSIACVFACVSISFI